MGVDLEMVEHGIQSPGLNLQVVIPRFHAPKHKVSVQMADGIRDHITSLAVDQMNCRTRESGTRFVANDAFCLPQMLFFLHLDEFYAGPCARTKCPREQQPQRNSSSEKHTCYLNFSTSSGAACSGVTRT